MPDEIRVGVAGLTHGHVWGLIEAWKHVEGARLVAVADRTPLLEKARPDFGVAYADYLEMLDKEQLDALVVTSDNLPSAQIAVNALERRIPCMVEKAMAANSIDAQRMLDAMERSGVKLMINWPLAWDAWLYDLKRRIEAGEIGHVFHLRYRNGHHGPKEIGCDEYFVDWLYNERKNGAGALADFCSYGAALCRWYFGMPESVYCIRGNQTKDYPVPDDHAVCILKYDKLSTEIEGTWATKGFDTGPNPVVHGKEGTLGVSRGKITRFVAGQEPVDEEPPPLANRNPAKYFVECIRENREPEGILSPYISADACKILDAAKKSSDSGCAEAP